MTDQAAMTTPTPTPTPTSDPDPGRETNVEFAATWSPTTCRFVPDDPDASRWWDPPGQLRGINLRSWIILELAATPGTLTIAQLVERLHTSGLTVADRASKAISDALRWETRRGRAIRLHRGHYTLGRLARTTRHRMHRRLTACTHRARTTPRPSAAVADLRPTNPSSSPEPHQAGVRQDLDLLLSALVVAPTRNTTNTTPSTSTHTTDRPPP